MGWYILLPFREVGSNKGIDTRVILRRFCEEGEEQRISVMAKVVHNIQSRNA